MKKSIIVVDDFYQDPSKVRTFALSSQYIRENNLPNEFAGTESVKCFYSDAVITKIESLIGKRIQVDARKNSFGVFAKSFAADSKKRQVHVDGTDWTAIIYLSKPEDCQGGTAFFRHRETHVDALPADPTERANLQKLTEKDKFDEDAWEPLGHVGMKFNRLLLFRSGSLFHRAGECFGTNDENARLLQLFFFNEAEAL